MHTVEHVLAAVAALEIDDLVIEMDGPEPPIMDGSAAPFFDALAWRGIVEQRRRRCSISRRASRCGDVDGESMYEVLPATSLELDVDDRFPHPLIGEQTRLLPRDARRASRASWRGRGRSASCTRSRRCARRG